MCEPVSVKTGLNDMQVKIQITASLESMSFSKRFLKICEDYHYSLRSYGLSNQTGSAVSLYDVINVDKYILTSTS